MLLQTNSQIVYNLLLRFYILLDKLPLIIVARFGTVIIVTARGTWFQRAYFEVYLHLSLLAAMAEAQVLSLPMTFLPGQNNSVTRRRTRPRPATLRTFVQLEAQTTLPQILSPSSSRSLTFVPSMSFSSVATLPPVVWTDRSPLTARRDGDDWASVTDNEATSPHFHHHHHRHSHHQEQQLRSSETADGEIPNDGFYINVFGRTPIDRQFLDFIRGRIIAGGFYHGSLTAAEARRRLANFPVGTFLVRDSSDRSRYPFAVTVRIASSSSAAASTSIRIVYESGRFRFDGIPETVDRLPSFGCVVELISHHVKLADRSRNAAGGGHKTKGRCPSAELETASGEVIAFVGHSGAPADDGSAVSLPVVLRRPLSASGSASPLKHLCRRRIMALVGDRSVYRLHLLPSLRQYLLEYPYDL